VNSLRKRRSCVETDKRRGGTDQRVKGKSKRGGTLDLGEGGTHLMGFIFYPHYEAVTKGFEAD